MEVKPLILAFQRDFFNDNFLDAYKPTKIAPLGMNRIWNSCTNLTGNGNYFLMWFIWFHGFFYKRKYKRILVSAAAHSWPRNRISLKRFVRGKEFLIFLLNRGHFWLLYIILVLFPYRWKVVKVKNYRKFSWNDWIWWGLYGDHQWWSHGRNETS